MQGILSRMQKHRALCHSDAEELSRGAAVGVQQEATTSSVTSGVTQSGPTPAKQQKMANFISSTTRHDQHQLDILVTKYFLATNTPFMHVEHKSFKMMSKLRLSYRPPTRKAISEDLLNEVYEMCADSAKQNLNGKFFTLSLDGWSNVPIKARSFSSF